MVQYKYRKGKGECGMAKQIEISKQRYPYSTQQCPYKSSFRRRTESEELFDIPPELFFPEWDMPQWMTDEFLENLFNLIQDALTEETLDANRKAYDLWRNEMKKRTK